MWHVSVSGVFGQSWGLLEEIARDVLRGVGNASQGEWLERGDIAIHLRRRLSRAEMRHAGLDEVVDVRGADEARVRIDRMRAFLPAAVAARPWREFP